MRKSAQKQSFLQKTPLLFDFDEIMPRNTPVFFRESKNELTPLHRHTYVEFFYTLEGVSTHIFNGTRQNVRYGDAYILTPRDIHGFEPIEGEKTRHMDICIEINYFKTLCEYFSPSLCRDFLNGNGISLKLSAETIQKIDRYVPMLFLNTGEDTYRLAAKMLTVILIELIVEHKAEKQLPMPKWLVQLLGDFNSRNNFQTDTSDLIKTYAYNANYMRRIFKKFVGMNMTDYFNRQKMDYAYVLLTSTDKSVEEICEMIGFNNISYFYHLFKSLYSKTPNQVRLNQ